LATWAPRSASNHRDGARGGLLVGLRRVEQVLVVKWKLALPLHPEFRTLPMLFYVSPLGPVLAKTGNGAYDNVASEARLGPLMSSLERSRIPLRYMASLVASFASTLPIALGRLVAIPIWA
jgi:nitrate reductase beta subunit